MAQGSNTNGQAQPVYVTDALGNASSAPAGTSGDPIYTQTPVLSAGADKSGTATSASAVKIAANPARRFLNIQNISATDTLGVNESGVTAAIGTGGTYTVPPGAFVSIRTNKAIAIVSSAAGPTPYTATEG